MKNIPLVWLFLRPQLRQGFIVEADMNLTRHCRMYSKHPSLSIPTHAPPFTATMYEMKEDAVEDAGKALRTASAKRNDQQVAGYMSMQELAEWVVRDFSASIDAEFPESEVPLIAYAVDVWTLASALCVCVFVCVCVSARPWCSGVSLHWL